MNTTELKKLADQCICHPVSRSTTEVESAGEAIKELLAINAELLEGLRAIVEGFSILKDSDFPALAKARAALAKAEGGEL